jgi:hypothetical protein
VEGSEELEEHQNFGWNGQGLLDKRNLNLALAEYRDGTTAERLFLAVKPLGGSASPLYQLENCSILR